jgi:hypothetical protein
MHCESTKGNENVIPAKAGIQGIEFTGFPPARE